MTDVEVRPGALADLTAHVPPAPGLFCLVDEGARAALSPPLDGYAHVRGFPPGEENKTWEGLGEVLSALDAAGIDRDGHLLAIGGGVTTDVGGLAAALHRRGIAWTAVPTTVVGQVDAALGGKTAVNLGGGKNTVGAFHAPARVLVDPDTLATLPERERRAGFGEVLKTALVDGEDLLAEVERLDATALPADVARRCLATKQRIVEQDPHDHGVRRQLNLGHTFGHAFEAVAMPALRHGEAVGLGLLCAARLAGQAALEERLRATLERWGLPVSAAIDRRAVLTEMRRDKKRRGGALVLVLPQAPGRLEIVRDPAPDDLSGALDAVLR